VALLAYVILGEALTKIYVPFVDHTSAPNASIRIHRGVSGLGALGISACARMWIKPKQVSTASESGRIPKKSLMRTRQASTTPLNKGLSR
jgi:hypothetical protein